MNRLLKAIAWLTLSVITFSSSVVASNFSIFLVRHAEKQPHHDNPPLTECGIKRAEQLAKMLSEAKLNAIYSSNYARTLATAKPSAKAFSLQTQQYDPRRLADFAKQLTQSQQNALVVGHSNTTPMLVNYLTNATLPALTEQQYSHLYHVSINQGHASVTTLIQTFQCDK